MVVQLHSAFDSEDAEQAKMALADPFIRHMDVEFSKLTRIIPLPKGFDSMEAAAKSSASEKKALQVDNLRAIDDDVSDIILLKLVAIYKRKLVY